MAVGLLTGAFNFALDTSPSSFAVKYDSIADRGDAFKAMRRFTTSTSPMYAARAAEVGDDQSDDQSNVDYFATNWWGMGFYFEATGGLPFTADGIEGANVFTTSSMRLIRQFEDEIQKLPSYPMVCPRQPRYYNASTNNIEWCVKRPLSASPTLLAYASNSTVPLLAYPQCCTCDGSSPVAGERCLAAPICERIDDEDGGSSSSSSSSSSSGSLLLRSPDGNGDVTSVEHVGQVMKKLQEALACGDKLALPGVGSLEYFVAKDFQKSDPPSTHTTRGAFNLGGIVDMTTMVLDTRNDAETETTQRWTYIDEEWEKRIWPSIQTFVLTELIPLYERFNDEHADELRISGMSRIHLEYEIVNKGLLQAAFWSIFSFAFVFSYMVFHTRSPFLTLMGLCHVLISFPATWAIYYLVFRIEYMGFLNFIALFVIMGIGADDIFVFVDAWKQSKLQDSKISGTIESRLEWTYRRAGGAMLVTSVTDACAFYANCINDITVIRIFGAFVGTMVMVNFVLVITFFPAVVVLWNKWGWEERPLRLCSPCGNAKTQEDEEKEEGNKKSDQRHYLEIFCADTFAPTFFRTRGRAWSVVVVFLLLTGILSGIASQLKSSDKDFRAESFPSDENLMRALGSQSRFELGSNDNAYLAFVMGLTDDGTQAIDRSGVDPNNPTADGQPKFLEDVDFTTVKAQEHYLEVCKMWRTNELVDDAKYPLLPSEQGVQCFADHFRDWVQDAHGLAYPVVPTSNFLPLLANFTSVPSNFTCTNNPKLNFVTKKECDSFYRTMHRFPSLFGRNSGGYYNQYSSNVWNNQIRWDTGGTTESPLEEQAMSSKSDRPMRLRSIMIEMNFTMEWDLSGIKARKIFNILESTQKKINDKAPPGLEGFHVNWQGQDSGSKWMQMRTDEIMQVSAFYGCGISVVFALVVLAIATGNLLIALLSFFCISCIVACCVGFMVIAGWDFGLMEAICVTICVGFSIDFVAHLAVAYNESADSEEGRYGKVKQALSELGISVTAAAVTTCGASAFMLPNYMIPFQKIGAFICFDIIVSLLFAVFLFSAMLTLCGPRNRNHWNYCYGKDQKSVTY